MESETGNFKFHHDYFERPIFTLTNALITEGLSNEQSAHQPSLQLTSLHLEPENQNSFSTKEKNNKTGPRTRQSLKNESSEMGVGLDNSRPRTKAHSATRRPAYRPWLGKSLDSTVSFPPLVRSHTDVNGFRSRLRRSRSPTPNYTIINKRASKETGSPVFQALNAAFKPIPRLFDPPTKEKEFGMKDMKIWENEVKKVVPRRPAIAINSDWQAPAAEWDDRDQYIYGPKGMFYDNRKYYLDKDFIISPEWISEKKSVSTYSRAYRTCALRYGWCC